MSPHGIFKHFEAGHTRHAWKIRTNPKVKRVFEILWGVNHLVVSYDGCCWIPASVRGKDGNWTHADQAPDKKKLTCYQGFVTLTDNIDRSLVVYEGSHLLHREYCREMNLSGPKDWVRIHDSYLNRIAHCRKVVPAKAGSLVVWDSRTFHQNQYGTRPEERIVQYVSYLPKSGRSMAIKKKRRAYFRDRRTTSHWAYPVKVNGKQPRTYGDKSLVINYNTLVKPELADMMEEIEKLI